MKYLLTLVSIVLLSAFTLPDNGSIHSFKVKSIEGGTIDFSKFKGKKILVVNTASKCGYTPQYEALQKVYDEYKDKLV
ncbi:MAG: glutathione peroxidase, partial [Sediminibacterium sp.]